MSVEREGIFEFKGRYVTVIGEDIQVGQPAPEFSADTKDWSTFRGLKDTQGKVRIIASLPSLNTSVCDRETRRFNEEAAGLSDEIAVLTVSMDLPYTLNNWCAATGVDKVITLSDHKSAEFGEKYGVLLKEPRVFRRAIFVVDRGGKVVYADYMPVLGEEPKYEQVLAAARAALS
jgi:thiol peroxidase